MALNDFGSGQQFGTGGSLSPSNDALYVHIAQTETITGAKTFSPIVALTAGLNSSANLNVAAGTGLSISGDTTAGRILVNDGKEVRVQPSRRLIQRSMVRT